jgi:hypothetical protein
MTEESKSHALPSKPDPLDLPDSLDAPVRPVTPARLATQCF